MALTNFARRNAGKIWRFATYCADSIATASGKSRKTSFILTILQYDNTLEIACEYLPIDSQRFKGLQERKRTFLVGIIRMAVLYRAGSEQIDGFKDVIWGIVENGLAIICACLPTYRPLLSKVFSLGTDVRAWYSSLLGNTRSWGGGSHSSKSTPAADANKSDSRKHYNQIEDGTLDGAHLTSVIGDLEASADIVAGKDIPLNSIHVKNTTEVV
ncbi:hypothetical protein MMC28_009489 [Mycoblastus sanguinarius]|nr:hypothetical protein [Mycoblastus sanguinarius]